MKQLGVLMVAAVGLAGCQSKPEKLLKQQPGNWSATFTLDSFDVPNAQPNYRADLEKALSIRSAAAVCVSADQAAKSDLVSELMTGQGLKECEFDENVADGGKLTVEGLCLDPLDRPVDVSIAGAASATNADLFITMSGEEQADQPLMLKLHAVLANTGACTAPPVANAKAKGK